MLKIKKIKPLFNRVLTTAYVYEQDSKTSNGIVDSSKDNLSTHFAIKSSHKNLIAA